MEPILIWQIATAAFVGIAIFIWFQKAEVITTSAKQKDDLTRLERDNKKLTQQLESQSQKLSVQEGKKSRKKSKEKKKQSRVEQQQTELQRLRSDLKSSEEKLQKATRDLNRVRIDREEMRQKLVKLSDEAPAANSEPAEAAPADAPATEAVAEPKSKPKTEPKTDEAPRKSLGKMERELADAETAVEKMRSKVKSYKDSLVKRESELRKLRRRNEHNRRAYIITQLQLDLANDEIYVLKHGELPPIKQADKQAKRSALRGETADTTEQIEILNRDNPIDLTAVGQPDAEELEAAASEAEAAAKAAPAKEAAKPAEPKPAEVAEAKPADEEEGFSLGDLAAPEEPKAAEPKAEADKASKPLLKPKASGSLLEQLKGRSVLRKKKPTGSNRAVAPPRPTSPPRPGGD